MSERFLLLLSNREAHLVENVAFYPGWKRQTLCCEATQNCLTTKATSVPNIFLVSPAQMEICAISAIVKVFILFALVGHWWVTGVTLESQAKLYCAIS